MTVHPIPAASLCGSCGFHALCLPAGLGANCTDRAGRLSQHLVKLPAGEGLFWAGADFENVYAVRSGCVKTCTVDSEGAEHVRGFHLPGDLIGLDAIHLGRHPASATAVEATEVCVISYSRLMKLVTDAPSLQHRMLELISRDLSMSLALAGDYSAEQRLAAFLLSLYQRLQCRGMTVGWAMHLVMPRRDIAAYLRLALETVSRVLTRFENEDCIEVDGRELKITAPERLWRLAEPVGICAAPAPRERSPARPIRFLQQACA